MEDKSRRVLQSVQMFVASKVAGARAAERRDKPLLPAASGPTNAVHKGRNVRGHVEEHDMANVREMQTSRRHVRAQHKHCRSR